MTYVADEIYEEVLTPYHMILDRNIDDNCTIDFNEMTSGHVSANALMQRKLLSIFKRRLEAEYIKASREKHIYNRPRYLQDSSIIVCDVALIKEETLH